jgi:hypothetical protein
MNFKELITKTNWSDVLESMKKELSDIDEQEYKKIFFKLLSYDPVESDEKLIINVEFIKDEENNEYFDVYGLNEKGDKYSLSMTSWHVWLGFEVNVENISYSDFVAQCLWEMTFYGNEEEMENQREELVKVADKIDSGKYLRYQEECPMCKGTGEAFGSKCFCDNGKINIVRTMKD